jgi:hypothetical protein
VLYTGRYAEPLARDIQAAGAANVAQLLRLANASGQQGGLHIATLVLTAYECVLCAGGVITSADLAAAVPTISQPMRFGIEAAACNARLAPVAFACNLSRVCPLLQAAGVGA